MVRALTSFPSVVLSAALVLGACTGVPAAGPAGQAPSPAAAAMSIDATRRRDRGADGAEADVVAVQVRVTDAAGDALMAPRLLVKVGEPASIRVGTDTRWTDVQVTTRREGSAVVVDAALSESGGPVRIRAKAQAADVTPPAGAK